MQELRAREERNAQLDTLEHARRAHQPDELDEAEGADDTHHAERARCAALLGGLLEEQGQEIQIVTRILSQWF